LRARSPDKKKIIKFRGSYHGWSDQFVVDIWVPYSGRFMANGIPEEVAAHTVLVPVNDPGALEHALKDNESDGGTAAVMVEPVGPESGTIPMDEEFPKEIQRLCRKYGALMVFDEVVTGFRVSRGGAQEYYGVEPELTVLGKLISSAFPSSGAVGGRTDIIETMQSGIMSGGGPSAFVAGTMAASPITMSAVYHSIEELESTGAIEKAAATADRLVSELNNLFEASGSLWFAYNYASILHVELGAALYVDIRRPEGLPEIFERKEILTTYQTFLRNEGLMTLMGKGYVTSTHTGEDVGATVKAFENLLDAVE